MTVSAVLSHEGHLPGSADDDMSRSIDRDLAAFLVDQIMTLQYSPLQLALLVWSASPGTRSLARHVAQARRYCRDNGLSASSVFDRALNPSIKQLQNLVAVVRRQEISGSAQRDLEEWARSRAAAGTIAYWLRRKGCAVVSAAVPAGG